jgi:integrase
LKKDLVTAEIIVKENKVGILRVGNINYISLSDLARYQNSSDPSFTVKNWLRTINTIDYIGLWEQIHNQDFNLVEFDQIKTEYGRKSFAMSPTQWIKRTNAIGIISKGGRYSIGTYVGIDITKYPFKVIHTKLGITKCRFYDLRGTYATKLSNSGTLMNDVSELMGHSNPSLLKNITLQV